MFLIIKSQSLNRLSHNLYDKQRHILRWNYIERHLCFKITTLTIMKSLVGFVLSGLKIYQSQRDTIQSSICHIVVIQWWWNIGDKKIKEGQPKEFGRLQSTDSCKHRSYNRAWPDLDLIADKAEHNIDTFTLNILGKC